MIESSSAANPSLALKSAGLASAPAEAGVDGAAQQDFSAVLAGAARDAATSSPLPLTTATPDFAAIEAGKTGITGNRTGKGLPVGNLPGETEAPANEGDRDLLGQDQSASGPTAPALFMLPPPSVGAPVPAAASGTARTVAAQAMAQLSATAAGEATAQPSPDAPSALAEATDQASPLPASAEGAKPAASEHKAPAAAPPAGIDAPAAARLDPVISAATGETRAAAAPSFTASAPAEPSQDLTALVDRIAEARAAAAPETVRAALMHAEFGAVSLRFRAENSHIHVTLGSADPGFAPAVHAAAAAAQANNEARDGNRRDQPSAQQLAQEAAPNHHGAQQQGSGNRTERLTHEEAVFGRSATARSASDETPSELLRRSGIYA